MLVAELARVWKIVGGKKRVVARDAGEDDALAADRADAGEAPSRPREEEEKMTMEAASSRFCDDVGEAVEREPELEAPSVDAGSAAASSMVAVAAAGATLSGPSTETTASRPRSPPRATKRQRKKSAKGRKGGSVIDDLFRGLD